jgi:hypothetical protein
VSAWVATTLSEHALLYAARGVPVFPCAPRSKTPATAHGFHDASDDLAQIEAWWWAQPRANIATPTGIAFDVVDFDHRDLYDQARDRHRLDGPQVATARGAHFYVAPTGGACTKLAPNLDFKGLGGYVLLPPSVHPSGARYAWIQRGDPQPAPAWLHELLDAQRPTRPARHQSRAGPLTPSSVASLRAMAERVAHCPPGNRNGLLFWCACTAADTGASADDVAIVLADAARRAGLGEREIDRTLASAFTRWGS